jgi:two-component system sensor histidine kinase HydH
MPLKNGRRIANGGPLSKGRVATTRLREAEEDALARILISDTESGILILDSDSRIAVANGPALRMFGLPLAKVHRRPAADLVRSLVAGDDPVENGFRCARTERETVIVGPGGGEIPVLLRTYRWGRPPRLMMSFRDLSQTRRMYQELRRHERLATLGRLAAGVAHEIRNPLAGIGTSAQVLLRRFEPRDERARFVRVILEEVARLDRIVTSLLQYARPRAPVLSPGDLRPCIERVLELVAEPIAETGLRTEVEVAPRLGVIYMDADLMTQVLLNVTLNAVQAMPRGGLLRYEVRRVRRRQPSRGPGRRRDDSGSASRRASVSWAEFVQVRVSDTGAGMPSGVLAQLFDPFFTTKPGGTGLGLSISQTIMQEHGGSIEVASREGHGTTVLLSLPVEKRHGERRESDPDSERAHAAGR